MVLITDGKIKKDKEREFKRHGKSNEVISEDGDKGDREEERDDA